MFRMDSFFQRALINATQQAYIEQAEQTHSILSDLTGVIRYLSRQGQKVSLNRELQIFRTFADLWRVIYPGRFSWAADEPDGYPDLYFSAGDLIRFTEKLIEEAAEQAVAELTILLQTDPSDSGGLVLKVTKDGGEESLRWTPV